MALVKPPIDLTQDEQHTWTLNRHAQLSTPLAEFLKDREDWKDYVTQIKGEYRLHGDGLTKEQREHVLRVHEPESKVNWRYYADMIPYTAPETGIVPVGSSVGTSAPPNGTGFVDAMNRFQGRTNSSGERQRLWPQSNFETITPKVQEQVKGWKPPVLPKPEAPTTAVAGANAPGKKKGQVVRGRIHPVRSMWRRAAQAAPSLSVPSGRVGVAVLLLGVLLLLVVMLVPARTADGTMLTRWQIASAVLAGKGKMVA